VLLSLLMNPKIAAGIAASVVAVIAIIGGISYWLSRPSESKTADTFAVATTTSLAPGVVAGEWNPATSLPQQYAISRNYTWYTFRDGVVSCMGEPMPDADATTFVASSYGEYGKDANHVYRCTDIVKEADPSSFVTLDVVYARDNAHIFYNGMPIPNADIATFDVVPGLGGTTSARISYGRDNSQVYQNATILPEADPYTFGPISGPTSQEFTADKNWIYKNDKIFGPVSLMDQTYAQSLPEICTEKDTVDQYAYLNGPQPSLIPDIFSKDLSVVGYAGSDGVCIIDKKTRTAEYYPYGWYEGVDLSDDGSQVYYNVFEKESQGDPAGYVCKECGEYAIDRATGMVTKL
jgi:hypothetical protein